MEKNIDLSIVVPCYNEEKNIPLIVQRFEEFFPKDLDIELILVDNGSTDNSNKVIADFAEQYSYIKTIRIEKNIGYGFGVHSGLKVARGNYVCWTHADMQTDIYDTIKAYNLIIQQKDPKSCFVKGNRMGRPLFDLFFTVGMSLFETIALGSILHDINAQPNLFPREFLRNITEAPKDFSFDLFVYYIAKKKGYEIIRFPVEFKPRLYGQSHWDTGIFQKFKFIKRTVAYTMELRKNIKKYKIDNKS
jgi:glycosyltransferase involved in cell wall biosynthesis